MYVYFHIPFRINGLRCCSDYKWDIAQNKCIRMLFFVQNQHQFETLSLYYILNVIKYCTYRL